jgi:hypothetical protein
MIIPQVLLALMNPWLGLALLRPSSLFHMSPVRRSAAGATIETSSFRTQHLDQPLLPWTRPLFSASSQRFHRLQVVARSTDSSGHSGDNNFDDIIHEKEDDHGDRVLETSNKPPPTLSVMPAGLPRFSANEFQINRFLGALGVMEVDRGRYRLVPSEFVSCLFIVWERKEMVG